MTMYTYRSSGPRVTAGQVNKARFSMTSLTRRGYQPDEVHRFLEKIADELASRDQREAALQADADKLREALRSWQSQQSDKRLQETAKTPTSDAVMLVARAQQQAESYVDQAQNYSRQIIGQAREQAAELMRRTQEKAQVEADRAVAEYRDQNLGRADREAEDRIRQMVKARSFLEAVEVAEEQLRMTRQRLEAEVAKLMPN